MPNLWIATPFAQDKCDGAITSAVSCGTSMTTVEVRAGSRELQGLGFQWGYDLSGSYNLCCGCYGLANGLFSYGDVLILVAHGKANSRDLFSARDCKGAPMMIQDCLESLRAAGASRLSEIFFAVSYSTANMHCANAWGSSHSCQKVYGLNREISNKPLSVESTGGLRILWLGEYFAGVSTGCRQTLLARVGNRVLGRI